MGFENAETDNSLVIQHDWHLALKEPISSFFLGVKNTCSSKTSFFDVQVTKLIDEFGFAVLPNSTDAESIGDFGNISLDLVNNLHVTYKNCATIFVSPVAELRLHGLQTAAHSFDVSTSGQTIVSADTSGNLVVSSAMNGNTLRILDGHIMDVYRCQYYPSDLVVLTGGMDLTLRIWAVDSGKCARVLKGHTQAITGIGLLGIGKEVLSCSNDGSTFKWNCGTGEIVEKWSFKCGKCIDLQVFESGPRFGVICELNVLVIIEEKKRIDIQLDDEPTGLTFSGCPNIIFVGFENGEVAAYDIEKRNLIAKIKADHGRVTCLKFYCNRLLVAYKDGRICAYRISGDSHETYCEFQITGPDCDPVYDMKFVGRNLYTSCRDKVLRKYTLLWNTFE